MIVYKYKVPLYSWKVTLVQVISKDDEKALKSLLKANRFKENDSLYEEIINNTIKDCTDGGITIRDKGFRELFVVFYRITNIFELIQIYNHEKRHIEDDILEVCGIKDAESAAYLSGYIGVKFYEFYLKVKEHLKFL